MKLPMWLGLLAAAAVGAVSLEAGATARAAVVRAGLSGVAFAGAGWIVCELVRGQAAGAPPVPGRPAPASEEADAARAAEASAAGEVLAATGAAAPALEPLTPPKLARRAAAGGPAGEER